MASLPQTIQVFEALLGSAEPVNVGEADEAIWAYLVPVAGLHAQTEALKLLTQKAAGLSASSAFMPALMDDLDRHRSRLAGRSV